MSKKSKLVSFECNYLSDDDMFWRVDAWQTDDENEEGKVIAYIDDLTGRVVYADPEAQIDKGVQALIKEKISEIKERPMLVQYQNGKISIQYRNSRYV